MRIKHSACFWCYPDFTIEEFCSQGKSLGLDAVDLLTPAEIKVAASHDLVCPMTTFPVARLPDGKEVGVIEAAFNRIEHHDALIELYDGYLREVKQAGGKNVICFSGNREGMNDTEGMKNCVKAISQLLPLLEELDLTLTMELLNSRVDHPDYMCDRTHWGVELCQAIGSDRFKLLYDIYHMQIMEGDIIATIAANHQYFSHYHTGGVPGRNEIDQTQELNYPAIMDAILATGYQGFVAQEFVPKSPDPLASLGAAIKICGPRED